MLHSDPKIIQPWSDLKSLQLSLGFHPTRFWLKRNAPRIGNAQHFPLPRLLRILPLGDQEQIRGDFSSQISTEKRGLEQGSSHPWAGRMSVSGTKCLPQTAELE